MYIFLGGEITLSSVEVISFLSLVLGSILIVIEKAKNIFGKSFIFSIGAAFYFAIYFVLAKFVYDSISFINGFVWIRLGTFLAALFFLFFREVRKNIFALKPKELNFKTTGIFIGNQIMGSLGAILQNWAVALAPLVFVAFVNSLQGVQYVFLLIFTIIFSFKFPKILKEEVSRKIIFQKIIAILLIGGGLVLLTLK